MTKSLARPLQRAQTVPTDNKYRLGVLRVSAGPSGRSCARLPEIVRQATLPPGSLIRVQISITERTVLVFARGLAHKDPSRNRKWITLARSKTS